MFCCSHFPDEKLGLRTWCHKAKSDGLRIRWFPRQLFPTVLAWSFCQSQHPHAGRHPPHRNRKWTHFGDRLRMLQLGEMIQLQIFQCQWLQTTRWLGLGSVWPPDLGVLCNPVDLCTDEETEAKMMTWPVHCHRTRWWRTQALRHSSLLSTIIGFVLRA